ncbi:hypothetical protein SSE37_01665 [Sagittula stellata E-37]|uniref:VWFA domain-containing protein n=2 Tax=Sagittula stellata TaxID=52603 RepID=A3K4M1_SAGS3|nr:hypothetical protein SSE37_01665 [Sagittula stellata E-37]
MMVLDSDTGQEGDGFPVVEVLAEVGSVIDVTPSQTVTVETPVASQDQPEDGTITRAELTQRVTHHDYVDVQFIIDGTRSMEAAFDAIKGSGGRAGVVQTLKEQIASELSGSKVRFGFTIYGDRSRNKDNPYGDSGLGASYFINQRSGCGSAIDDREIARNARDFQQRFNRLEIKKVVQSPDSEIAKKTGSDDWEENVAGGLEAGFAAIEACPWHRKIVILIGDSGYSRDNQVAHGFRDAPSFSTILSDIQESRTDPLAPPVMVLGVQMPPSAQSANFDRAYALFPDQVADLIAAVSPETGDFYKVPSTGGAAGSISDRIGAMLKGQASTLAFKCALENNTGISFSVECGGGEPPAPAPTTVVTTTSAAAKVETVSGEDVKSQAGGVPFNMATLQNRLAALRCSDCSGIQGEVEGLILYVRLDPDVFQPEVLMTDEDLSSWKHIANRLAQEEKLSDQRRNVQLILLGSAEGQLGIRWRNSNAKLHEFLGAATGLPDLFQTPILSYKYRDFQSEALVGNCELRLLQEFAEQSSEMLEIIQNGRRPVPVVSGITGGCDFMSAAGEAIPRYAKVAEEPFGTWVNPKTGAPQKTGYRYEGLRDGDTENIYWIPNWALP